MTYNSKDRCVPQRRTAVFAYMEKVPEIVFSKENIKFALRLLTFM